MPFSSVVGHEKAIAALRRALCQDRVPGGYLLVGPPHIGKTTLALAFAQAANCPQAREAASAEELDACGECELCERIGKGAYPDVRIIRPRLTPKRKRKRKKGAAGVEAENEVQNQAEEAEEIEEAVVEGEDEEAAAETPGAGQPAAPPEPLAASFEDALIDMGLMRSLIAATGRTALHADGRRVYIIAGADTVNDESGNLLLKTLEEPPSRAVFILTTSRPASVLPTIRSRCQEVRMQPLHPEALAERLQEEHPDLPAEQAQVIAAMAMGGYGRAQTVLEHPELLELRGRVLDLAASLPTLPWWECLRLAEVLIDTAEEWWEAEGVTKAGRRLFKEVPDQVRRNKLQEILAVLETWFRDVLAVRGGNRLINADYREELETAAHCYPPASALRACHTLQKLRGDLRQSANVRLALEALLFRLLVVRRESG